ncbi:DNA-processing protein DprA [Eubacterium sp.]
MKEEYKTEEFRKKLKEKDIKMVCVGDRDYPEKLMPYRDRPEVLFYKGRLPDKDKPIVAMVGARACSNYGRTMAKKIAGDLAYNNVQIISGMARGIDTYSQLGAVEAGGATFAVLGCGVDICYPTENIELYENIIKTGGIISEYPPGDKPLAWHFPMRNRIISGLSDKVVVVEAKEKSGSLITVEWALEQGKDVMAVPGCVDDKLSEGCNRLIRSGAGLVRNAKDVLEELKYEVFNKEKEKVIKEKILEKDFLLLYSELGLQPKSIEELMEKTGIEYGILADMLLQLQLRGLVEQPSDNYYSRLE